MKVIATLLVIFVIGGAYSVAVPKNSASSSVPTTSTPSSVSVPKSSTPKPTTAVPKEDLVSPGVTVSKGFTKANCLASRFAVLCASSSTIDGCVTKNSKTKCGKQCVCGTKDCSCGTSGCYCQVDGGCRCNGSK